MIGRQLGRYQVLAKLGEGGMGEVYLALDPELGREIALKLLPRAMADRPDRLDRFRREAQAVAALNHPHIVTLHSIEEHEGQHFLTMERVEGETLEQLLPKEGYPFAEVLEIAIPLADALAAAHEKGIVHRDLKLGNVMRTREGRIKVLDFGLAKLGASDPTPSGGDAEETALYSGGAALTEEGTILGTAPYMSPEQLEGRPVDHRSDLFSFGVLLYLLATGQRPFQGESSAALISSILRDTPPPATGHRGSLPRHFDRILEACLEKDSERRIQSAKELRNALERLRRETQTAELSTRSPAEPEKPRRLRPLVLAATLLLGGVLAVGAYLRFGGEGAQVGGEAGVTSVVEGPEARLLFEQAQSYASGGGSLARLELAEQTLRRAVALEPDNLFLVAELADLLARLQSEEPLPGRRQEALDLAERAAEKEPVPAAAWTTRARLALLEGEGEAAVAAARSALATDPTDVRGAILLGNGLLKDGRPEEGLEELRRSVELEGGAIGGRFALGTALLRLGRLDEAASEYRRVLDVAPGHVSTLNNLANVYLYSGRYLEAVPLYHSVLELQPDELAATNLGTTYYYLDRMEEALASYLRAEELAPGQPWVQNNIGDAYHRLEDAPSAREWHSRAIESCDRRLEGGGDRLDLLGLRALLLAKVGRMEEARQEIGDLVDSSSSATDEAEIFYTAAQIHALAGDREQLLERAEQALRAGYPREELRRAPEFAAFQNDPEFQQLLTANFD